MTCIHDYTPVKETKEAIVESCSLCKHKLVVRKDSKGRYDNKEYLKNHARDFIQPTGKDKNLFIKLYGTPCKTK